MVRKLSNLHGAIAQLGERIVRNDEVVGSIPTSSTNSFNNLAKLKYRGTMLLTCFIGPVMDQRLDQDVERSPVGRTDQVAAPPAADSPAQTGRRFQA
jgi:hypothetical protein